MTHDPSTHGPRTHDRVVVGERPRGRTVTLGGGDHGVGVAVDADVALAALDAPVADVTDPEG